VLVIIPTWFICPKTDTHSSNSHLIATRPEVKSTNSRSQVKRPNRYITTPLNELISYVNSSKNNLFNWIIVDVSATAAAFFGTTVHQVSLRLTEKAIGWTGGSGKRYPLEQNKTSR